MNTPAVIITPELRQRIVDYSAVIQRQLDAGKDTGHVAARVHLFDALPVLSDISDHWSKAIAVLIGRQVAPFFVGPDTLREMCHFCGAVKAAKSLKTLQLEKGDAATSCAVLLAIFNRALKGRVFLTQDLPCENDINP